MKKFEIKGAKLIALILASVLVLGLVIDIQNPTYGFFAKVDAGHVGIPTTFGHVSDNVLEPGFHVTNFFTNVIPMDVREKKESATISAFSSDIQQVDVCITANYSISKDGAINIYKNIGTDYFNVVVAPRILENTKVVFAGYTAENLVAQREKLSDAILERMRSEMSAYGITINSISIENIDFTDTFTTAVEDKQVASQNKLTAQTRQEQMTMEAEAEAKCRVIEANSQAEVDRIAADTEAYALRTRSEAQAQANTAIAQSLTDEFINYRYAEQWNGELPATYIGAEGTMPVINTFTDKTNTNNTNTD